MQRQQSSCKRHEKYQDKLAKHRNKLVWDDVIGNQF